MTRIDERMTLSDVAQLPGFEPLANYLMECRPATRERMYAVPLAAFRATQGDAAADAIMAGLTRLDKVVRDHQGIILDLWTDAEKEDVPGRGRTKLVHFPGKPGAPFVMVCPGGGYNSVCSFMEGYPAAARLNAAGYHAFVLSYRTREDARFPAPVEDLARALHLVLEHADDLGTTTDYALMGFSAGAHLAGTMATARNGWQTWGLPCPKAAVLCYPALDLRTIARDEASPTAREMLSTILGPRPSAEALARWSVNEAADETFPPTYLWQCEDDDVVPFDNLRLMDVRLEELGVPHEAVSYPHGGHGLVKPHDAEADAWMDGVLAFLGTYL